MGQPHHRGDQHVEQLLLVVDVVVEEATLEPEPGVVDQQPDRARPVPEPGLDKRQLVAVGEIGGQHLHLDVVRRPQVPGHRREPVGVAGHQDQVVAATGEPVGEGQADAGGGAGDECGTRE